MSYDAWKCTDTSTERESDIQIAVDRYQELVWAEVVKLLGRGGEAPREASTAFEVEEAFDGYRDMLHDHLLDDRHPVDSAQLFLESRE